MVPYRVPWRGGTGPPIEPPAGIPLPTSRRVRMVVPRCQGGTTIETNRDQETNRRQEAKRQDAHERTSQERHAGKGTATARAVRRRSGARRCR